MIELRIAQLLGYPIENGEGIQVLHYGVGGEYTPHFDYFRTEHSGAAKHLNMEASALLLSSCI